MIRLEFSIEIKRSPEHVFALIGDPENDVQWQSAVVAVRKVTPGPIRIGSRYQHTLSILGKHTDIDVEFTERRAHSGYVLKSLGAPFDFEMRVQLKPSARGTLLEAVIEGRPSGVARIAAVLISHHRRAEIKRDLRTLKKMLESGEL
jgi:carbon monoxide dehydrogenase subunit G